MIKSNTYKLIKIDCTAERYLMTLDLHCLAIYLCTCALFDPPRSGLGLPYETLAYEFCNDARTQYGWEHLPQFLPKTPQRNGVHL